jgi:hypothetical protein
MSDFWNSRYAQETYAYGIEPNVFYAEHLPTLSGKKILFVAEGEGRNAVYAAQQGYDVTAYDLSEQGQIKALRLAAQMNVTITYHVGALDSLSLVPESFDGLVLIFAHFPAEIRKQEHHKLLSLLKPGGKILFEAFAKTQLGNPSGGPKDAALLFDEMEVRTEFTGIDFELLETVEVDLDEGPYHQGKGNVVRCIGTKTAV